jgi:hypothetical protein
MYELEQLLKYCVENDRVCPMPLPWHQVWDMLPSKKHGSGWEPPPPPTFAAWWEASDEARRERLIVHFRWANEHGVLDRVAAFLRSLPENEWHHRGE